MTTTIESNGSKWAGQAPDPIEDLYSRLQSHTLDPSFEDYGNFIMPMHFGDGGGYRFWGNFLNLSAVFNVRTDDKDVIDTLTALIRDNQGTPDYRNARHDRIKHQEKYKNAREAGRLGL